LTLEPASPLLELATPPETPASPPSTAPSTAPSPLSPPLAAPPSTVPPPPRASHQAGWDLCKSCRKHYHHKTYYHCWFCNFK
jgi:hypothetical protein